VELVVIKKIYPRELNNALPLPSKAAGYILAYFTIAPVKESMINKLVGLNALL
jgi:hypothetical protein